MNDWIIENDVPIPPRHAHRNMKGAAANITTALKNLCVGQSLFTKSISASTIGGRYSSLTRAWGYRYVIRNMDDGVRVWRIE